MLHWMENRGVRLITLGWTAFIAENLILSENKEWLVNRFGSDNYRRAYSVCSIAACSSIAFGYVLYRRKGPEGATPGPFRKSLAFASQTIGLVVASQSIPKLQSPVSINQGSSGWFPTSFKLECPLDYKSARNHVGKITRHPLLMSFGFICLGPALRTKFITERIMFGFPILMAFIGGWHQDVRGLRSGKLSIEEYNNSSLVPFMQLCRSVSSANATFEGIWNEFNHFSLGAAVLIAVGIALKKEVASFTGSTRSSLIEKFYRKLYELFD